MTKKKQLNPFLKLALDIGPLILFFAANAKFGIYAATGAFMAAVLIALAVSYVLTKHVAIMPLVTAVIVLVFGGLTLVLHDDLFIKVKPTIIYVLFGGDTAGRAGVRQAAARHGVRFRIPLARRRLAQADLAVGAVLFCARNIERDRLAHADDGLLGQLQIVRRRAADIPVRRAASATADEVQRRQEKLTLDMDFDRTWKSIAAGPAAVLHILCLWR